MIKHDYHIHTKRCKHAVGEMEEYIEQAIRLGFREIAFTDHTPLPDRFDRAHRMALEEIETYVNDVLRLKDQYSEIEIKLGLESDFYDGFEPFLEKLLQRFPFDIVLMSVHFLKEWQQGNWVFSYHFPDRSYKEIYRDYFRALKRGIRTGLFDVIAHMDLIKSPQAPVLQYNAQDVNEVLKEAAANNMAIELNTSGWHKAIEEMFPAPELLPLIVEAGLAVTTGSDAHQPGHVGYAFDRLFALLEPYPQLKFARFNKRCLTKDRIQFAPA